MTHTTTRSGPLQLRCANKWLDLTRPAIMGILNVTPDSFVDGGRYNSQDAALERVALMLAEGADIIDIGAESSRPHAQPVPLQVELDRLMPILQRIKSEFDVILSVDTYKPQVMAEAINSGVHMINDIFALQHDTALSTIAQSKVAVCLMHMQGQPQTMQLTPQYDDITSEVTRFLEARISACRKAGIDQDRLVIDPGFGFGKTTAHNFSLLKNMLYLQRLNSPIMVGLSRKSSIGEILTADIDNRVYGSLAAHVVAFLQGASIIRTHDVKPTADALKIAQAIIAQE